MMDTNNNNSLSANTASGLPKLSLGTKLAFGIGAVGENVYLGLFNSFIAIFYNQILGLSNTLIGTAIMLALIVDGITDPLMGIVSDRFRSRHGRRHPFLFVAPVPIALAVYYIFNPPEFLIASAVDSSQLLLFVWLAAWTIISRVFLTLYHVPHLALGGELSKDQHERSQLFSVNAAIGYASGAAFGFIAWSFFFAGERIRESDGLSVPGHLDASSYLPLVLFVCALIIVTIWTCAAGTYNQIPRLSKVEDQIEKITPRVFFREVLSTLKNRNYLLVLIGFFFLMLVAGVLETTGVFMNTYFWELAPKEIRWFGLTAIPSVIFGALMAPVLMKKLDRKPVLLIGLSGVIVFCQLTVDLRLLGLMPENHSPMLLPILLANVAVFVFSLGLCSVAVLSMLGDIVDENELQSGRRQEGLFYSARALFAKASSSFGHLLAGVGLDLFVKLPFKAVPGQLDDDLLVRLGIMSGPVVGVLAITAFFFYQGYYLPRDRHKEIIAELKVKGEANLPGPAFEGEQST